MKLYIAEGKTLHILCLPWITMVYNLCGKIEQFKNNIIYRRSH